MASRNNRLRCPITFHRETLVYVPKRRMLIERRKGEPAQAIRVKK